MTRKRLEGKVKAVSGAKTVKVEVVRFYHHPLYRKRLRATKRYLAHFEGEAKPGQAVVIEESRPISLTKRWRVVEIEGKPVAVKNQISNIKDQKEGKVKRTIRKRGGKKK